MGLAASVVAALIGGALLVRRGWTPRQLVRKPSPPSIVAAGSPHSAGQIVGQIAGPIVGRPANEFEIAMLLSNAARHITLPKTVAPPVAVAKATPDDFPGLIQSLDDPAKREASIRLLAHTVAPAKLVQIAVDPGTKTDTRNALCAALLTRGDASGTDGYLQLVENSQTHDLALDVLHNFDDPPIQPLIEQLHASLVDRRLAAARALGCLCHGPTFAVLQRMVEDDISRREAMIALLYCPNPAAKEYLDQLRSRPVLGQELQAVKCQMQLSSQPNI